jgi:hypothetical protein
MVMGIPYVYRLRRSPLLKGSSLLYPFELAKLEDTISRQGALCVHSEVFLPAFGSPSFAYPRDKGQVLSFVSLAESWGRTGRLSEVFYQVRELPEETQKAVLKEEGWGLVL